MTALASLVHSFAAVLTPVETNTDLLIDWITAALTLAHHNDTTEGVNAKIKLLKRQIYGRAGFQLLRHRILLS